MSKVICKRRIGDAFRRRYTRDGCQRALCRCRSYLVMCETREVMTRVTGERREADRDTDATQVRLSLSAAILGKPSLSLSLSVRRPSSPPSSSQPFSSRPSASQPLTASLALEHAASPGRPTTGIEGTLEFRVGS